MFIISDYKIIGKFQVGQSQYVVIGLNGNACVMQKADFFKIIKAENQKEESLCLI